MFVLFCSCHLRNFLKQRSELEKTYSQVRMWCACGPPMLLGCSDHSAYTTMSNVCTCVCSTCVLCVVWCMQYVCVLCVVWCMQVLCVVWCMQYVYCVLCGVCKYCVLCGGPAQALQKLCQTHTQRRKHSAPPVVDGYDRNQHK